jgi:hypothetical protein
MRGFTSAGSSCVVLGTPITDTVQESCSSKKKFLQAGVGSPLRSILDHLEKTLEQQI